MVKAPADKASLRDASDLVEWLGSDPYLRLYHAINNFDLLNTFLKEVSPPAKLEMCHDELSMHRWDLITSLFNDKKWEPMSRYLPSLHAEFDYARRLPAIKRTESTEKIYERFQKSKSQMEALRTWCLKESKQPRTILSIMNTPKEDEKLASMNAFPSHLLYLWHYRDTFHTLDRLCDIPSSIIPSKRTMKKSEREKEVKKLGLHSIRVLQMAECHHRKLVENYGYLLTKLGEINGQHQERVKTISDTLAERIEAAKLRIIAIEEQMMIDNNPILSQN